MCNVNLFENNLLTEMSEPPDKEEDNGKNNEQPDNMVRLDRFLSPVFAEIESLLF